MPCCECEFKMVIVSMNMKIKVFSVVLGLILFQPNLRAASIELTPQKKNLESLLEGQVFDQPFVSISEIEDLDLSSFPEKEGEASELIDILFAGGADIKKLDNLSSTPVIYSVSPSSWQYISTTPKTREATPLISDVEDVSGRDLALSSEFFLKKIFDSPEVNSDKLFSFIDDFDYCQVQNILDQIRFDQKRCAEFLEIRQEHNATPLVYAAYKFNEADERSASQDDDPNLKALACIIKKLINFGFDVNSVADNDFTALHFLVGSEAGKISLDLIKFFVDHGAKIHFKNDDGDTAFTLAQKIKNFGAIKIFRDNFRLV